MKIVLIQPPIRDFYNTAVRRQPLGLLYLAAALLEEGHEVKLVDSEARKGASRVSLPASMEAITWKEDSLDASPFKLFGRFHHYGPSLESIAGETRAFEPELVGISSLFSAYSMEAMACAEQVRAALPAAAIVMGGGHPSSMPGLVLQNPAVDFAVLGEGERTLSALVKALDKGTDPQPIPGLAGRGRDGRLFINPPHFDPDMESIVLPARELLDLDAYRFQGRRMAQILSSRGCPYRCAFCSARLTSGPVFRPRKPVEVVAEMVDCHARFGVEAFDFEDDNLTCHIARAEELMTRIIDAFGEKNLWLEAMNGISMRGLTPELLRLMKAAGFRNINLSPLATDGEMRASMKRPEGDEEALDVPAEAARAGLRVTAYQMIGYPGQELAEMMAHLHRWAREEVLLAPSVFYPAPGSKVQKEIFPHLDEADESTWALMRSSLFPQVPGGIQRESLRTVFWMIRMANFARSVTPDRDGRCLVTECRALLRTMGISKPGTDKVQFQSIQSLGVKERGLAALALYLMDLRPQGIRLLKRGRQGAAWAYEIFPLPGLIKDRDFYRIHAIPGFDRAQLGMEEA